MKKVNYKGMSESTKSQWWDGTCIWAEYSERIQWQPASIKSNKGMTNIYENRPEEVYTFVYTLVSIRIY